MKYLLPLAFFVSLLLYHPVLDFYFFQDDFFEINISKAQDLSQYLSFFKFRDDIIAYRPISLQNYFFISQNLFGASPTGARTITFILFFISGFLIYKLVVKIFKNTKVALVASFLWLTSSIHFMSLTWIAAAYNIIGTFFWLLTSVVFFKYLENKKISSYFLSVFLFIVTVGSYEFSITWPAIWGFYCYFILKNSLIKVAKLFSPYIFIGITYLIARLIFIKVPQILEYQIAANIESLRSFFWYILWSFNIPEEFKKQVVTNLIGFNSLFLAEFWKLTIFELVAFLWILALAVAIPTVAKRKVASVKLIFFSLIFFAVAISPVLLLPNHTFSMYLTLASIGIYLLLAYLLTLLKSNTVIFLVLLIWTLQSFVTVSFYRINSWMGQTQNVGRTFASQMKNKFPSLPSNSTVFYWLPYPWQWQALSYGEAIKTIYNDPTISIYYNEESLRKDFAEGKLKGPIYIYEN